MALNEAMYELTAFFCCDHKQYKIFSRSVVVEASIENLQLVEKFDNFNFMLQLNLLNLFSDNPENVALRVIWKQSWFADYLLFERKSN